MRRRDLKKGRNQGEEGGIFYILTKGFFIMKESDFPSLTLPSSHTFLFLLLINL